MIRILSMFVGLGMFWAMTAVAADTRIGVVDMEKALRTVEAGKTARAQLEKDFNAKKQELQKEEANIKKLDEEFKKKSLVMSDDAKAKKQNEIRERIMKFQEVTARAQMDIQQKEQEMTQPIIKRLRDLISEMAKDKKYTVVLEKNENTVLFSQDNDDMTDELITKFNKAPRG